MRGGNFLVLSGERSFRDKMELFHIILLLILLITSVQNEPTASTGCLGNRIQIGDKFYDRQLLWAKVGRPHNLIVHKPTNTLFFSYSSPEMYSDVDFQLSYYNIDTEDYQTIAGLKGGCSIAIDSTNDEIFIGGSDGIYKFNMITKRADFYKEKGKNIWSLFHRKNLFYISYPDQKLYIEHDGRFPMVKEFANFEIDHFFITSSNDVYFANKTGLILDSENMKIEIVDELINVRQIAEDNEGVVYICSNFGILIEGKYDGFKKIANIKNLFGLTFDRDNNFVISDESNIIILKPSNLDCNNEDFHF